MRIDKAEEVIQDGIKSNELIKDLSFELIKELKGLNLINKLLKSRINKYLEDKEVITKEKRNDTLTEWFDCHVEREYVHKMESLERVSFRLLRNTNKGIILEAHQRLTNKEESWSALSNRWGCDPERQLEGYYKNTPAKNLGREIVTQLKRLKPGEVTIPITLGKYYSLLMLEEWEKIELNDKTRKKLIENMMDSWLNEQVEKILLFSDSYETSAEEAQN